MNYAINIFFTTKQKKTKQNIMLLYWLRILIQMVLNVHHEISLHNFDVSDLLTLLEWEFWC